MKKIVCGMMLLELVEAIFTAAEAGFNGWVLGYHHEVRGTGRERSKDLRIKISGYVRKWFPYLQSIRFINNQLPCNPTSFPKPRHPHVGLILLPNLSSLL